jgi:hypothetical protein
MNAFKGIFVMTENLRVIVGGLNSKLRKEGTTGKNKPTRIPTIKIKLILHQVIEPNKRKVALLIYRRSTIH